MKKKVLILAYSYPPINDPAAQRPYAVAKYIDKKKFEVTVITCGNVDSSLGFNVGFDPELPDVNLIVINSLMGKGASNLRKSKMEVRKSLKSKLKSSVFDFLSSMIIPDKAIFWYPKVLSYLKNNKHLIHHTEIVFTSSPSFSNHLLGKFLKKRNKSIKWITEFRDFYYLERCSGQKGLKSFINRKLEYSVINQADKTSFISYSMYHLYSSYYSKFKDKFSVIYNGFDMSDFKNLDIARTQNEKLTIFYAGSFYRGVRSPVPLFQILDNLIEQAKITINEIEILIAGNFENELLLQVQKYKSFSCVTFMGNIPRNEVLKNLVSSDLLWLIVGNKPTHYTGVPIKFFEYLGARRPILNFAPLASEPTRIIAHHGLGWSFNTTDFDLQISVEVFEEIILDFKAGILSESLPSKFLPEFDRKEQGMIFGKLFSPD